MRLHKCSYRAGREIALSGQALDETRGVNPIDVAPHGGCFPLHIIGTGVVGTITVSGIPQRDDHNFVVECLEPIPRRGSCASSACGRNGMMTGDVWFWVLAGLATLFVGSSKGGLPLVGMLAVPLVALQISPVVAAGLLLPIYIVSDVYGLWLYRKSYDLRNIKIIVPAAAIGIAIGWATVSITSDDLVKLLVGIIGLVYCVDAVMKARRTIAPRPADVPRGIFWGAIAGFTSFVSHSGAPPYQMYVLPQRLEKMVYAGTSTIVFAIINLLKLPPYWFLGQVNLGSLRMRRSCCRRIAIIGAYPRLPGSRKSFPRKSSSALWKWHCSLSR